MLRLRNKSPWRSSERDIGQIGNPNTTLLGYSQAHQRSHQPTAAPPAQEQAGTQTKDSQEQTPRPSHSQESHQTRCLKCFITRVCFTIALLTILRNVEVAETHETADQEIRTTLHSAILSRECSWNLFHTATQLTLVNYFSIRWLLKKSVETWQLMWGWRSCLSHSHTALTSSSNKHDSRPPSPKTVLKPRQYKLNKIRVFNLSDSMILYLLEAYKSDAILEYLICNMFWFGFHQDFTLSGSKMFPCFKWSISYMCFIQLTNAFSRICTNMSFRNQSFCCQGLHNQQFDHTHLNSRKTCLPRKVFRCTFTRTYPCCLNLHPLLIAESTSDERLMSNTAFAESSLSWLVLTPSGFSCWRHDSFPSIRGKG